MPITSTSAAILILTLQPIRALIGSRVSWFVYVVRLPAGRRDAIMGRMLDAGIGCGRYFAPIHLQRSYAAWRDFGETWL